MKKGLLFEFLELDYKMGTLHEHEDEFAEEVPGPDYSGDMHVPDMDNHEKMINKQEEIFDLEKEIPAPDYQGDTHLHSDIPGPDGMPDMSSVIDDPSEEEPEEFEGDVPPLEPGEFPESVPGQEQDPGQIPQEQPVEVPPQAAPDFTGVGQEQPPEMPAEAPGGMPPTGTPPGMGGMPPGMGGMPGMPGTDPVEHLDPINIGKVYILKKIYSRLIAVHDNLSYMANPKFDEVKKSVEESIEHFQNVIKNFDQFKDKLDEVIVLFQRFLVGAVDRVETLLTDDEYTDEEM